MQNTFSYSEVHKNFGKCIKIPILFIILLISVEIFENKSTVNKG